MVVSLGFFLSSFSAINNTGSYLALHWNVTDDTPGRAAQALRGARAGARGRGGARGKAAGRGLRQAAPGLPGAGVGPSCRRGSQGQT